MTVDTTTMNDEQIAARLRDLVYCRDVLHPESLRLQHEEEKCLGIPWRYRRWRRTMNEHKALNARWQRILDGEEHAP